MDTLPVDEARDDFERALATERPVVVVAPTGSGKSTRIPIWLAERADETTGPVLVVEPRRVACRSLATYLAEQRGESAGESIGYRVRFDDRSSKATRILFVTTGIALRMIAGDGPSAFSSVMIDEFHERGWEVDLLGAALMESRKAGEFDGPLVFTSATVDAASIARKISAEVVEASGRTFPVDISYREGVTGPTSDGLSARVRSAVEEAIGEDDGDILVFLPGKGEISDCESALTGVASREKIEVVGVHGGLPMKFISRAFSKGTGKRRVFLSTNVAETSLTLPGVTTVIDSGLARMRIHRGGRSALAMVPISLASMDQRAGRAGRVRPGQCVRLWSRRFQPDEETRPEIQRIELDDVLLQAARCGLEGKRFDEATWLTEPPEFAVKTARERLQKMGACNELGEVTDKGQRMASLPVGGDEARILIDPPKELAATVADLVALLQLGRDLMLSGRYMKGRSFEDVREARTELLAGVTDEVFVQLHCLRYGNARRHGLHGSALKEARRIATSLRAICGVTPGDPQRDQSDFPTQEELADYLLRRIPESAFVVRNRALKRRNGGKARRGKSEPWGNGEIELAVWPFEPPVSPRADGNQDLDHPVAGLVLDHFWLGNQGIGVRGTGRMVLPCSYQQLIEAEIGEEEVEDIRAGTRGGKPYVRAKVERTHAGVLLESGESALRGNLLCEKAAEAILEGRILRPAGEKVLDDLHVWDLMARWPEVDRTWTGDETPPEPQIYLADLLGQLGVQRDADLMLVEPEDLRPDVVKALGAYRYDVESMAEDFPRIWTHQGFSYTCRVRPNSRQVVLEPVNKKTARADDPAARFVPRFRGFCVKYKNASRVVPIR